MGFLSSLFGQFRMKRPQVDPLFRLVTAEIGFLNELGWSPSGTAGICVRKLPGSEFEKTAVELKALLGLAADETGGKMSTPTDEFGFHWYVFRDPQLEDLVGLVHLAGQTLTDQGYGEQLLAAVFGFVPRSALGTGQTGQVEALGRGPAQAYMIYAYKRGAFYPFVPKDSLNKVRDHAQELRAAAIAKRELPIERDQSRWFALWGLPV